jgi:hypothetical protein
MLKAPTRSAREYVKSGSAVLHRGSSSQRIDVVGGRGFLEILPQRHRCLNLPIHQAERDQILRLQHLKRRDAVARISDAHLVDMTMNLEEPSSY